MQGIQNRQNNLKTGKKVGGMTLTDFKTYTKLE